MAKDTLQRVIYQIALNAKKASSCLASASSEQKKTALQLIANEVEKQSHFILSANQQDLEVAHEQKLSAAFIDRLTLTEKKLQSMVDSINIVKNLKDPIGELIESWEVPSGLKISKVRVPLGVIGVIYESRPNVTLDAASLCLKSGNAVILRGGKESFQTSTSILTAIQNALKKSTLPENTVQMIPTTNRKAVEEIVKLDKYIDVIIPRGGKSLIEHINKISQIPLFKHLSGLCHTYLHKAASKQMARDVVLNAKMRRTGICGATEVLIIDREILHSHLPDILSSLIASGCEVRGPEEIIKLHADVKQIDEATDYDIEWLNPILSIKVVENIAEAIAHIQQHGTNHTDAIITDDVHAANRFLQEVNSAIVMHNTSTQFADGGEFGFGAEIGIATGKLHARGPVGVQQLTTFKYLVQGNGELRK